MLRFWVRDNGKGIPTAEQTHLFRPFTQLSQVHTKGFGLGLAIVRRIIEKLGGTVGVESQPIQGSCFYFTLPDGSQLGEAAKPDQPEPGLMGLLDLET
jgi:two-component system sensor histidine kinase/response regulator